MLEGLSCNKVGCRISTAIIILFREWIVTSGLCIWGVVPAATWYLRWCLTLGLGWGCLGDVSGFLFPGLRHWAAGFSPWGLEWGSLGDASGFLFPGLRYWTAGFSTWGLGWCLGDVSGYPFPGLRCWAVGFSFVWARHGFCWVNNRITKAK